MSLDRLELLEVRLGSGKVYLVPRALLENLVQALPVSAPQLIVSASPSGGPLDPSGLPSEVGWGHRLMSLSVPALTYGVLNSTIILCPSPHPAPG